MAKKTDNSEFEFDVRGMHVTFTPQDDPERVALGEVFEKITGTPPNATGGTKDAIRIQDWQDKTSMTSAIIRYAMAGDPGGPIHYANNGDPLNVGGFLGWIPRSLLGTEPVIQMVLKSKAGDKVMATVTNAYTHKEGVKVYGLSWNWGKLFELSAGDCEVWQDDTFGDEGEGEKTTRPFGSLLQNNLRDLHNGVTIITYPLIRKYNGVLYPQAQSRAQWFYATLCDIRDGKTTLEKEAEKYWLNRLFFSAEKREEARLEAKGILTPEIKQRAHEDAVTVVNGGTPAPRDIFVLVDGVSMQHNAVVSGNYNVYVGTRRMAPLYLWNQAARGRLEADALHYNGNLRLEKVG